MEVVGKRGFSVLLLINYFPRNSTCFAITTGINKIIPLISINNAIPANNTLITVTSRNDNAITLISTDAIITIIYHIASNSTIML